MWKHSTTAIYVIAVTGAPGLFTKKIRRSQHPSVHGMRKYQWEAAKWGIERFHEHHRTAEHET
jgi:hypothetical protein